MLLSPSSKLEVLDIGTLDLAIEKLSSLIWSLVDCPQLSFIWGCMGGSIGSFDNCNDYND